MAQELYRTESNFGEDVDESQTKFFYESSRLADEDEVYSKKINKTKKELFEFALKQRNKIKEMKKEIEDLTKEKNYYIKKHSELLILLKNIPKIIINEIEKCED